MSAGAVIVIRINRILGFLRNRRATSPESAIAELQVPYSDRWYYRRLVDRGVIKKVGDKCYLDETVAQAYLEARRKRALLFITIAILAFCVFWLVWART